MVVNRGLHETSQAQVVFDVDIKDALVILTFLYSPMVKQHFNSLSVALSASDVQSVTAIGVLKVNVYVLLQQKLHNIELILACSNQQGIPCEIIWQIAVSICVLHEVVDQHVVSAGATAGVQKCVVTALLSLNLHIDKKVEVYLTQAFTSFGDDLLHGLDVSHDASYH